MKEPWTHARTSKSAGFSLVELLIVVAIIAAMSAVSLPAIGRYIRNYRINAAKQAVAGEMNVGRSNAIVKNANLGVVFAVVSSTQYRWVVEDDQRPQTAPNWFAISSEDWTTLTGDPVQAGPLRSLPVSVVFDAPGNCPGVVSGTDTWGVRFTQIGSMCAFASANCGAAPPGAAIPSNLVRIAGGKATVCLLESSSGLRRTVSVTTGGRVLAQP